MTRWLETDSLSNQNISSALAIGAYTADADRLIICDVSIDQAAGNGDYVMYITKQIGGAGSAYVVLPKTTMTAASGETAISGQSGLICVRSGDVLTVYVDGLAGDTTTPDTIVRWFELAALRPATADRTIAVDASGQVTTGALAAGAITAAAIATGAVDADALAADAGTEIGTAVWASSTRTLTQAAASVTSAVSGSTITITRGDTLSATLTGLSANTDYVSILFTVKSDKSDADASAILQIKKNASGTDDGLLYLNAAAPVSPVVAADGSITVNSSTSITIALAARAADDLVPADGLKYDVQYVFASSVLTATEGICNISADVTRAIA